MSTDAELRISGLRALVDALGPVDAERFITLMLREPFDYTAWRQQLWPGRTVEELSEAAMQLRRDSRNHGANSLP
jgi:hypothetical protein